MSPPDHTDELSDETLAMPDASSDDWVERADDHPEERDEPIILSAISVDDRATLAEGYSEDIGDTDTLSEVNLVEVDEPNGNRSVEGDTITLSGLRTDGVNEPDDGLPEQLGDGWLLSDHATEERATPTYDVDQEAGEPVAPIDHLSEAGIHTIVVGPASTLAQLRAQIAHAEAPHVLLEVPAAQASRLTDGLWLKGLARQAYVSEKELAVLSRSRGVRQAATMLALTTVGSASQARRTRWKPISVGPPLVGPEFVQQARARRVATGVAHRESWNDRLLTAGLLFALIIVMGAILLLLVPGAQVAVLTEREPLSVTFPVVVASIVSEDDTSGEAVLAEPYVVAVQGTLSVPTTGQRDMPAGRATGTVLFINVAGEAVTIPAGTIVSTSAGTPVRFRTTGEVSLPAEVNSSATAAVEAVTPGPTGNVQPFQIRILEGSAAGNVRVLNEEPLEGGDVQLQSVVTQEDKDLLRQQLEQQLLVQGRNALENNLEVDGESQILLPASLSIEVTAETFSAAIDDPSDQLSLDLRAQVSGVAISQEDLMEVGTQALEERVPDDYRLDPTSITVTPGEAQRGSDGLLRIALRADGTATALLSPAQVRELVRGKSLDEAHEVLESQLPLASPPLIELSPEWWSRLPLVPLRISVSVQDAREAVQ